MQTLTVKIAEAGTILGAGGISFTGHVWLSIDPDGPSGSQSPVSMGWAPNWPLVPNWQGAFSLDQDFVPGKVMPNDDGAYTSTWYAGTICITGEQYAQLLAFREHPENFGFSLDYSLLSNSCIDFAWKGLEIAGLNSSGFEGIPGAPTDNASGLDRALYTYLNKEFANWQSDKANQRGYDVIYGSGDDDTIQAMPNTDAVYGGVGNDTLIGTDIADKLYGGDGNDTLTGNAGDDYLEGGKGNDKLFGGEGFDTYYVDNGDYIRDTNDPGLGKVIFDGKELRGGSMGNNGFEDADGHHYTFIPNLRLGNSLLITNSDQSKMIAIGKFKDGDLGIHLEYGSYDTGNEIPLKISTIFTVAQRVPPSVSRDPLTLDLDGDGLETTGFNAANPIYFDHDVNGVKEGTGWVLPDDGLLVLDRNGNQIADLGSYTRGDGSVNVIGETSQLADVNFAIDTFHRQFATTIPPTPEIAALPDMPGRAVGWVGRSETHRIG